MLRAEHVRSLLRGGVAATWMGFALAACQGPNAFYWGEATGLGGDAPSGAAGTFMSGAAGTSPTGTAGSSGPGTAGSILTGTGGSSVGGGAGGAGDATGTAGTTGAAGATGAAGRGGTTGTGGSVTGRGGTTGAGGAAGGAGGAAGGRGGTTGTAGTSGRGGNAGTTGLGGRGGAGGAVGRGGTTGTAGATGAGGNSCPLGGRLDCTTAGALQVTPDGAIVDFSTGQWNATAGKFCDMHGLDGSVSSFAGTPSTAAAAVDTTAQNLKLNFMVTAGQYAGGRVNFDSCVDARSFNSIQFTASLSAGSLTGCTWQVQLETQDQRPSTATNPTGGTCNATTTTCERYPAATLTAPTATAMTYTTRFTAFSNPAMSAIATPGQITGLQWQVNSGNNGSGTCTVEVRIDGVKFVTQ